MPDISFHEGDTVDEEIRRIAGIFISNWEAKLSKTRKEDWVRWIE